MSVIEAIGWLAALASATVALPQAIRIATTRSVAGVSVATWQCNTIAGIAWTGHGLIAGTPQILWPNGLLALTSAAVLWQLTSARGLPVARTWSPALAVGLLAVGLDVALGPVAFAVVAFIPGAIAQIAQLREIRRAPAVTGVSMGGLLLGLWTQIVWLAFAIPSGEVAIICVATPISALCALSIHALLLRRRVVAIPAAVAIAV